MKLYLLMGCVNYKAGDYERMAHINLTSIRLAVKPEPRTMNGSLGSAVPVGKGERFTTEYSSTPLKIAD